MSSSKNFYITQEEERICQGDIISDVTYEIINIKPDSRSVENIKVTFKYIIVLMQDCDLSRDYENRHNLNPNPNDANYLHSILVAPLFNALQLREGTHLSNLGLNCKRINTDLWKPISGNENKRYYYLPENDEFGVAAQVIDFKHCYSFPTQKIYDLKKSFSKFRVNELYREDISQRFSYYISRIGLPE